MSDFKKRVRLAVLTLALIIPCIIVTLSVTATAATLTVYAEETESCEHAYKNGFCTSCDAYEPCEGEGSETNPYLISNAGNLYWFAQTVNSAGGKTICAKVTEDIIVNSDVLTADGELNGDGTNLRVWTPIAADGSGYSGTFDGNGKTIKGLYYEGSGEVGLFGKFKAGIIKNIHLKDSYLHVNGDLAGGIVGTTSGSEDKEIYGCSNEGSIKGTFNGAAGGIVGMAGNLTVKDCYNTGRVSGQNVVYVGGIIGHVAKNNNIENCYNFGSVSGERDVGGIAGSGTFGQITNCYYLINCAVDSENKFQNGIGSSTAGVATADIAGRTTAKTAEEFASGEVTYLLNGSKSVLENGERPVWGQKIYYEELPRFGSKIVYCLELEGSSPITYFYSNDPEATRPYRFDDNGLCTEENCTTHYQSCDGDGSETNPYLISNAGNLYWFAQTVNSAGGKTICAKVTEDIIVNSDVLKADGELNGDGTKFREWTPIGSRSNWYNGTFDGNGKTIRGLYCKLTESGEYAGLFAGFEKGTIKDIHVEDSYLCGYLAAGGIVGYIKDSNIRNEKRISGCSNKESIVSIVSSSTGANGGCGGIVGYGTAGLIIEDCYNTGTVCVNGKDDVGGIIGGCGGQSKLVIIKNCYNTGSVSGRRNVGGIVGKKSSGSEITNCYYLINCAVDSKNKFQNGIGSSTAGVDKADIDGSTTAKTAEEFASGEVTYLLNGSKSAPETGESLVWYQTAGEGLPAFSGNIIYCGYRTCAKKEYTNDSTIPTERPEHTDEDSDKKCDVCEEWLYGVELKGSNITLGGNIGLNYYFAFDDEESIMAANDATVRFIIADDRVADVPASSGIKDTSGGASGGLYKYSCELYAKQMTDKVKVQFIIDGNTILEYEQSVVDYANDIIKNKNGEYSEDAIALVKAMLNYGANAQLNFNYNTDNLANKKLSSSDKELTGVLKEEELDTVLGDKKTKVTAVEGVGTFIGSSLVLESETTLKVYFEPCEGVEADTLKFTVDGKDVEAAASGEYLVIAVTDIKANELNTDFTISVSSNEQSGEFKTSVYGYCYRVLKGADGEFTDELKNTVKALYCYSEAAQKYIGK